MIRVLSDAFISLAAHTDVVVDRLNAELEKDRDISDTFGEELSRLRAEVIHLRGMVAGREQHDE